MITKKFLGLCVGLTMALGAGVAAAQSNDPVRLGLIMPTKSLLGKQAVQAAEIAVDLVKEDGGILGGREVQLVVYDDGFSPVEGVAAAQRLISEDRVKFIMGQFSSTVALAMVSLAEAENIVYMPVVAKHPDITKSGYDKIFRLNTTTTMDMQVLADFLRDTVKPEKIAYIGENNDFGRQMVDLIREVFPGDRIAYAGYYDVQQSDFNALLTDAKASGADTLFTGGSSVEQYANVIRGAAQIGFNPEHVVLSPGTLNQRVVDLAGAAAEGAVSVDIYVPSFDNALNQRFVEAYQTKYGQKPEKTDELSFEAVWIMAHAIDKAGTDQDVDKVAEALRSGEWETPRGAVTFDETGQAKSTAFVIVVRDGEIVRY